mgnify:CR=1 FL=1
MQKYTPPIDDYLFLLYEIFEFTSKENLGTNEYSRDLVMPILNEAGRLASEILLPTNANGDKEGCRLENGSVKTPSTFRVAFEKMRSGEWPALNCDPQYGGQGVPLTVATPIGEFFGSANVALSIYNVLSHGVYSTIKAHGTESQKEKYLPKLANSEWTGTMNLTEPQCGTDLGLIKTKAVKQSDNSYKISGQKIYISAGDHDLSENIIHLVLAKIPGSPPGVKGISMFIVPKFLVGSNESKLQINSLSVGKVETKMGIHGNATCVMNYDDATGYLLGPENKGLSSMFTMMNEARHATGMQGLALASIAYQNASAYAKERTQGKSLSNKNPSNKMDPHPIIVHPDVRRMLMEQKSFIEGARAFAVWSALLIDKSNIKKDTAADARVSILIPIFKAFLSDKGFYSTIEAQQVFGGHGYVEDFGMSQYARDARIAMLYEGTNGIQAIDLVGRKLIVDGGKHLFSLISEINTFLELNSDTKELNTSFLIPMKESVSHLQQSINYFMEAGISDPENVLSGATDFLHLFGNVILGYMWCQIAKKSYEKIKESSNSSFYEAKVLTGKFFMARSLPETKTRLARVLSDKSLLMDLKSELF